MKRITMLSILGLFTMALTANAQEYKHTFSNSADRTVEIAISNSDVVIEGYDGNEVVIRNLDYEDNTPPERAKGLKSLYNTYQDNTGIGVSVEETGNTLKVIQASRDGGDFRIMVPNKVRIMAEEVNWMGSGDYEVRNHNGEIELKTRNGDMSFVDVTGPIIASSTSGDVEIVMSRLSQAGPTSISLVSGFVDLTMPENSKATFELSSISGEIYTNMDIQVGSSNKENDMRRLGGPRKVEGTLNGGGVEVQLKSISGNIYLRKK